MVSPLIDVNSVDWANVLSLLREHLMLTVYALTKGVVAGLFLGILCSPVKQADRVFLGLDRLVTILPALALAGISYSVSSTAEDTVAVFLTIYAFIPVMRGSYLGARAYDMATVESFRAMGMSFPGILIHVRLPSFIIPFLSGLRKSLYLVIGGAALCALLLPVGLGVELVKLKGAEVETVFAVSLVLAALALVVDLILGTVIIVFRKKRVC